MHSSSHRQALRQLDKILRTIRGMPPAITAGKLVCKNTLLQHYCTWSERRRPAVATGAVRWAVCGASPAAPSPRGSRGPEAGEAASPTGGCPPSNNNNQIAMNARDALKVDPKQINAWGAFNVNKRTKKNARGGVFKIKIMIFTIIIIIIMIIKTITITIIITIIITQGLPEPRSVAHQR